MRPYVVKQGDYLEKLLQHQSFTRGMLLFVSILPACGVAYSPAHPPSVSPLVTTTAVLTSGSTSPVMPPTSLASVCPAGMVEVPGGTFTMGDDVMEDGRAHQVTLDPFCLDVTPVTVGAYARCSTCRPRGRTERLCNAPGKGKDDHPQNCVSWADAVSYCASQGKVLPTEAQFEFAASGGAPRDPWRIRPHACVGRTRNRPGEGTCPVGSYPPGPFGLQDMVGNVWEWVADWYGPYSSTPQKNPLGPSAPAEDNVMRCMRGGAWNRAYPEEPITRGSGPPNGEYDYVGFRCAKERRAQ